MTVIELVKLLLISEVWYICKATKVYYTKILDSRIVS